MAFQQGLSGLGVSSKALDVIGNNVANSSTVGFKSAQAHFSDVYANALGGAGASQVGIGSSVAAIQQQFTQGNITTTNNPLDIAINGDGFFRMDTNGSLTYTRNGQFHLDNNGYIINDQGAKLTGYGVDQNGTIIKANPSPLQLSSSSISPLATGASIGGTYQGVLASLNLDSREAEPDNPWVAGAASGLAQIDATTYNYSTPVSVYDSLGNAHNLTLYFVKTATTGEWDVHATVDGTTDSRVTITGGPLKFSTSGALDATSANLNISIDLDGVMSDLGKVNSATPTLAFNIDFTGSTQFGTDSVVNKLKQDGYTAGSLTGVSVGADGVVSGNFSNGQSRNLGQVVLVTFANPNGLASLGNNQWAATSTAGEVVLGTPDSGSFGVLQALAIEESNVDLTSELVAMITAQRNYQANAQTIKTQDQVMQTLVNLR